MAFTGGAPAVVSAVMTKIDSVVAAKEAQFQAAINAAMAETGARLRIDPYADLQIQPIALATSTLVPQSRRFDLQQLDQTFQEKVDEVALTLADAFDTCVATNFPAFTTYVTAAESWLSTAIAGGTGVNAAVEDQIWARERARTLRDAARASDEALTTWAGRGFTLPPGALVYQTAMIDRDAAEKIGESSRERAIKTWDIEVENVRFSVGKSLEVRVSAVSAALEYMKTMSMPIELGLRVTQNVQAAHQKLNDVLVQLYEADQVGNEFNFKLRNTNLTRDDGDRGANLKSEEERRAQRIQTVVSTLQAVAQQASSALNGLHAQATIAGTDSTNTSIQG